MTLDSQEFQARNFSEVTLMKKTVPLIEVTNLRVTGLTLANRHITLVLGLIAKIKRCLIGQWVPMLRSIPAPNAMVREGRRWLRGLSKTELLCTVEWDYLTKGWG